LSSQITVLTYNLHKGFTAATVLRLIENAGRDPIYRSGCGFLQEVQGTHTRKAHRIKRLAGAVAVRVSCRHRLATLCLRKKCGVQQAITANAILSKYPYSFTRILISARIVWRNAGFCSHHQPPDFDHAVHLLCMHLDLFEYSRQSQIQKLKRHVLRRQRWAIRSLWLEIFNDWRRRIDDALLAPLEMKEVFTSLMGRHQRTFPSFFSGAIFGSYL